MVATSPERPQLDVGAQRRPFDDEPAVIDRDGHEIGEGIMDALCATLIAMHDLQKKDGGNSVHGSMYVVKPKMHGPEESLPLPSRFSTWLRTSLGLPAQHCETGHHGRRTPHIRQFGRMYPCRKIACGVYQHRVLGPHRRRNPYQHGSRRIPAQRVT